MTNCPLHPGHSEILADHEARLRKQEQSYRLPPTFWLGLFGFLGSVVATLGHLMK